MRDILTDRQWLFLSRFAEAHKTTLAEIAAAVLGTTAPAARPAAARAARGTDRKLVKDRARCAAAIAACEHFLQKNDHTWCAHNSDHVGQCRVSVADERIRLEAAYNDLALLWNIYRRADKSAGYGITIQKQKAA